MAEAADNNSAGAGVGKNPEKEASVKQMEALNRPHVYLKLETTGFSKWYS